MSSPVILSETNFTRFEVVQSRTRNMVSIRTTYNNKFLRLEPGSSFLVATAHVPEEDRSKESCTLFRYVYNRQNGLLGLLHQSRNTERTVIISSSSLSVGNIHFLYYFSLSMCCYVLFYV